MPDANEQLADYVGLRTDDYDHAGIQGQRVEWVAWDSPAQELAIGDVVLEIASPSSAVSGKDVPRLQYPASGTSALWAALDADPGKVLSFHVLHEGEAASIEVRSVAQPFYHTPEGKRSLFPDGPYASSRAEIGETWSVWYERIIEEWSRVLCDGWRQRSFKTRDLLQAHAEEHRAVAFLLEKYPGPFADSIARRWHEVGNVLQGTLWPAEAVDLSYREFAEERRERMTAAGAEAHAAYQKDIADTLTDAFPAPDPYETESGSVAGRIVSIDRVSPRNMRNDGVHAWYILGDKRQGWYFLDVYSPEVVRMWDFIDAYQRQVTLHLAESYRFYLRLTEEPMMRAKERRNVALGFKTQLVAAWIGNELFLSDLDTPNPLMAGSDLLQGAAMDVPTDNDTPVQLAEQRIAAMKRLRRDRWEALFADWKVARDFSARPIYLPYGDFGPSDKRSGWEQCQKRLFSDVLDVKVLAETGPYTVLPADPADGTPHVEECEVIVEHVGHFDEEYRSFKDSGLTRAWRLQRVDGGPWRFVYPRGL